MLTCEKVRKKIINGMLDNPELGVNYIDWHTENYGECGVTIMCGDKEEQFDIIIKRR